MLEAHQRIDLALARGRCGLWDWDMVRGKMYWSRSMYDMLGYEACDRMLSFGEVADIIHDEDGDLFDIATKIVSREIDHIDQVFRMRHASGQWIWMRVRAHVIDPEAPEIQLIGIARRRQRATAPGAALGSRRHAAAGPRSRTPRNPSCCGTPPTGW